MKTILTIALLYSFQLSFGQIAKGTWSIGPDVDYSHSKTEIDGFDIESTSSDLQLGASIGYYVIDNLEIGITTGIFSSKDEIDDFESTSSGFFIGPNIQYKIALSDQFYLPLGGGFTFNSARTEDDRPDETKLSGISYNVFAGIEFVANKKLGAFLHIGPEFGTLKEDESELEFDATLIAAGIGFRFYF